MKLTAEAALSLTPVLPVAVLADAGAAAPLARALLAGGTDVFLLFSAGYGAEEVTSEMSAARFGRFDELPTLLTGALGKRA
mgnify:CR=1 FL=1